MKGAQPLPMQGLAFLIAIAHDQCLMEWRPVFLLAVFRHQALLLFQVVCPLQINYN